MLDDLEEAGFEDEEDEEDDDDELDEVEELPGYAMAGGIDAIARKQARDLCCSREQLCTAALPRMTSHLHRISKQAPMQQQPATMPQITEEMRRSSDKVDWDALSSRSLQIVEAALQPRKQEWLVVEGKPVPGAKGKPHEGAWFEGDPALGWAALPDTEEMPRMVDGSMLEWANINTKLPSQEGYLEARCARGSADCARQFVHVPVGVHFSDRTAGWPCCVARRLSIGGRRSAGAAGPGDHQVGRPAHAAT